MNSNDKDPRVNLIPEWIKAETFVNLLKQEIPNYEKIKDFKTYPALQPGENYATFMVRVIIDVELKDKSIVKKLYMMKLPNEGQFTEDMKQFGSIFKEERDNIREFLPELEHLYHNAGIEIKFGPTAYVLPQNPDGDYVIMDDLGLIGFKNVKRTAGLDVIHMERALKKLAQYHAASATRVATKGPFASNFNVEAGCKMFTGMVLSFKESFLEHLTSFKDGIKYEKAVINFFDNLPQLIKNILRSDPIGFNVQIHGDFWCNNIMFKYTESNEIEDVIFVDFQSPRWGPAALDLLYLIISSAQIDIKLAKFDYFIRFYYNQLISNLKLLKYSKELPTLNSIFIQFLTYGEFGFLTAIMTMAGVLLESTDKANINNLLTDTADAKDFRSMLYANQLYHDHINLLLPWLYNQGLLKDE